jgi:hypothetical protein
MDSIIKCCRFCVAPKRYPGCHSTCPEYRYERALYDERKAAADQEKFTSHGLTMQRCAAVRKAMRGKR